MTTGHETNWSAISTWIALVTMGVAVVLRFGAIEEAKENAVDKLADHEDRLRTVELDRSTASQLEQLKIQITELKGEVRSLRAELASENRRRR